MEETRYAILIGINDYKNHELRFSENDVIQLSQRLIDNCGFIQENVFPITSTKKAPIEDVKSKVDKTLNDISLKFNKTSDSILFYFSGHGKFENETFIELHDLKVPLQSVYDQITTLEPRNQIYILDACHSGFGVEFRSSEEEAIKMYYNQRYIAATEGTFFLCSCKEDEKSQAFPQDENGVFTKYIIEAIDTPSLYDFDNSSLSIPIIHEYALKKILLSGKYNQTPFIQMKSSGYYPFAFLKDNGADSIFCKSILESITDEKAIENFFRREDLNLTPDLRRDLFHFCSEYALNQFQHGYTTKVDIHITGKSVIIYDYSNKPFDPLKAKPSEDGIGVRIFQDFINRYKNVCEFNFFEGSPNRVELKFSAEVQDLSVANPCFIEIENESVRVPTSLNSIELNPICKELIIDATKALIWGSMGELFLSYLIKRTEETQPLIIIRMDKNDFTRKYLIPLTKQNYYSRIIIV